VTPEPTPADLERRRIGRQRRIVLGVLLTMGGAFVLLLAPDLSGPLVRDLPYFAVALVALYAGGILLGVGYGQKAPRGNR